METNEQPQTTVTHDTRHIDVLSASPPSLTAQASTHVAHNSQTDMTSDSDGGDAVFQTIPAAAFDDGTAFTITVSQALDRIENSRRRVPSLRTVQRLCGDSVIRATKIRTSMGAEWLINELSLLQWIETQPVELKATTVTHDGRNIDVASAPTEVE